MRSLGLRLVAAAAALVALAPLANAQWYGPQGPGYWEGRREHCERMRERLNELRYRVQYAPPWERERLEPRMYELRGRLRAECRGWRD